MNGVLVEERMAVVQDTPPHFRIAVGGDYNAIHKSGGLGIQLPAPFTPRCLSSLSISECIFSVCAGLSATIAIENKGVSTSVLIPSERPLHYRACLGRDESSLLIWFAKVERQAWEYVHTFFNNARPDSIFLVIGQTLTDEYFICHLENISSSCEVSIEPNVNITHLGEGNLRLGYGLEKARASLGFWIHKSGSNENPDSLPLFSVYLQMYESFPIRRIQVITGTVLNDRIGSMFRYQCNNDNGD